MIYKVSYVVLGGQHPGTIRNEVDYPVVGDTVQIGDDSFRILEVLDLIPSRGDFGYLHVTCESVAPLHDSAAIRRS
jgi:hypothetical protein